MTSQYPPDRQPGALEKAVLPESLQGVGRAGGREPAAGGSQGRDLTPVEPDQPQQELLHGKSPFG